MSRARNIRSFLTVATSDMGTKQPYHDMPHSSSLTEMAQYQLSLLNEFPFDNLIRGSWGGVELCYVDRKFKGGAIRFSCFPITENENHVYTSRIKFDENSFVFVPLSPFGVIFKDSITENHVHEENRIPHLFNELVFKDVKSYFLISLNNICEAWRQLTNEELNLNVKNYQELGLLIKSYKEMLTDFIDGEAQ